MQVSGRLGLAAFVAVFVTGLFLILVFDRFAARDESRFFAASLSASLWPLQTRLERQLGEGQTLRMLVRREAGRLQEDLAFIAARNPDITAIVLFGRAPGQWQPLVATPEIEKRKPLTTALPVLPPLPLSTLSSAVSSSVSSSFGSPSSLPGPLSGEDQRSGRGVYAPGGFWWHGSPDAMELAIPLRDPGGGLEGGLYLRFGPRAPVDRTESPGQSGRLPGWALLILLPLCAILAGFLACQLCRHQLAAWQAVFDRSLALVRSGAVPEDGGKKAKGGRRQQALADMAATSPLVLRLEKHLAELGIVSAALDLLLGWGQQKKAARAMHRDTARPDSPDLRLPEERDT